MDIEMLLIRVRVTNALYMYVCIWCPIRSSCVLQSVSERILADVLRRKEWRKSFPSKAHDMKSHDMLNSQGLIQGERAATLLIIAPPPAPLSGLCILRVQTAGLRLFFGVLCLLVVWGGNDAGRKVETA